MKTFTAVLFAGGESRRMGVDKATLVIDGEPLWSRQLRLLRQLEPQQVMISARSRPAWCPPEVATVLDASPSRGPLTGLAAVLTKITTTHALVLALDLPLMEAGFLRGLWAECGDLKGIVPVNGDVFEPLCAIYPATAAHLVNTALTSGDFSMRGMIGRLLATQLIHVLPVGKTDNPCFLNLNTLADVTTLKHSLTSRQAQDGGVF